MKELLSFTAFMVMAFGFHKLADWWDTWHHACRKCSVNDRTWLPWLSAMLVHPHFWQGIKEYIVHLVVYSGIVLPPH